MYNEDCPNFRCKDCKWYRPVIKGHEEDACNRRIDHKRIEYAVPWFKSSAEETGFPCKEFEPSSIHVWCLKNYWTDWEHWWQDWIDTWMDGKTPTRPLWFTLNGDRSVRYTVDRNDYINGTMFENGKLKAIEKAYYKQTRSGFGYKLVKEKLEDGVEIE